MIFDPEKVLRIDMSSNELILAERYVRSSDYDALLELYKVERKNRQDNYTRKHQRCWNCDSVCD